MGAQAGHLRLKPAVITAKRDSKPLVPIAKQPVSVAEDEFADGRGSLEKRCPSYGGTEGSNPACSSGVDAHACAGSLGLVRRQLDEPRPVIADTTSSAKDVLLRRTRGHSAAALPVWGWRLPFEYREDSRFER